MITVKAVVSIASRITVGVVFSVIVIGNKDTEQALLIVSGGATGSTVVGIFERNLRPNSNARRSRCAIGLGINLPE